MPSRSTKCETSCFPALDGLDSSSDSNGSLSPRTSVIPVFLTSKSSRTEACNEISCRGETRTSCALASLISGSLLRITFAASFSSNLADRLSRSVNRIVHCFDSSITNDASMRSGSSEEGVRGTTSPLSSINSAVASGLFTKQVHLRPVPSATETRRVSSTTFDSCFAYSGGAM